MKTCKRFGALLLALILTLSLSVTAYAAVEDTGFSDVAADAWYADAVTYVRDNGLMSGTSDTTFTPGGTMTRGMLVTTLYRMAGSPSLENEDLGYPFADVPGDAWYADGVYWARLAGVVGGYSEDQFGPDDPVTREQIAVILWRYAGSPAAESGTDFADEGSISAYAAQAVDWARANGIVNGVEDNRFLPQSSATRAQVATILRNYLTMEEAGEPEDPEGSRVLVAYFSWSGNTEAMANLIAEQTGGTLFEIAPATPYTDDYDALLDVAQQEQAEDARPELAASVENWDSCDVIFVGYPDWWSDAPMVIYSFLESYDWTGKTLVPFCTSGGSGFGRSLDRLSDSAPGATILEGLHVSGSSAAGSGDQVAEWIVGLGL